MNFNWLNSFRVLQVPTQKAVWKDIQGNEWAQNDEFYTWLFTRGCYIIILVPDWKKIYKPVWREISVPAWKEIQGKFVAQPDLELKWSCSWTNDFLIIPVVPDWKKIHKPIWVPTKVCMPTTI